MNNIQENMLKCESMLAKGEIKNVLKYTTSMCSDNEDIPKHLLAGNIRRAILVDNVLNAELDDEKVSAILSNGIRYYIVSLLINNDKCSELESKYLECVNNGYFFMICNEAQAQFQFAKMEFVQLQKEYNSNMSIFDSIEQMLKFKYKCEINVFKFVDNLINIALANEEHSSKPITIVDIENALQNSINGGSKNE